MVEEKTELAGTSTGNSRLRQTIDQIYSLIFLSHSIKVFASKWKLIRHKLDEIHSILSSLSPEFQALAENNPTLSAIVHSIEETTNCSNNLAQKCIEHSYSGKLLMQSDLDIIYVKFDNALKSLSELINTDGFLSNGNYAIVVSRPGPTASRDDIKFYVKDLLSRFRIGHTEMKKQALISFNEVIREDERYVKIAMEIEGLVHVLMKFLNSKEIEIQEEALKSVVIICGFDSYKSILIGMGVVGPLIRVLEIGSDVCKELSTRCLMEVTANSDNAWSISANGGASALLKICGGGCDDAAGGELIGLACGVLRNLIGVDEIKKFVVDKGGIPLSIKLVRSKNEASHTGAIEFIQVLASGNEYTRGLIVNEGGIRVLVRVLDPRSSYSSKAREKSMRALMTLCSASIGYMNSLRSYGFIDHILYILHIGETSIQESALRATSWLCGTSDEYKKALGDAGFISELVKFLDAKSFESREIATETLSSLLVIPRNQKRFVQNDQYVNLVLQLLDPGEANPGNKKALLSIIMSLTFSTDGRKKILSSRYFKNIENLAEDQVLDAKKIIRNLSSNRLRTMIRGIWHS